MKEEVRLARVRKANELIQKSRFSLSLQQQKIILYLISKIQPTDTEFHEYKFEIKSCANRVVSVIKGNGVHADIYGKYFRKTV